MEQDEGNEDQRERLLNWLDADHMGHVRGEPEWAKLKEVVSQHELNVEARKHIEPEVLWNWREIWKARYRCWLIGSLALLSAPTEDRAFTRASLQPTSDRTYLHVQYNGLRTPINVDLPGHDE